MIAFRNFALRRGEHLLLSDIDLTLHSGTRVGVVGRNGCGKSSLFAAILGEVDADRGDIDMPTRLRIASVAQETPSLPDSALDFVLSGDQAVFDVIRAEAAAMDAEDYDAVAEAHQKLDELNGYDAPARAGKLLHGLGFGAETHTRPVSDFSGGWRVRLNLARALMKPSDLLLQALQVYRAGYRPSADWPKPHAMVGVNGVAADSDDEAAWLFTSIQQRFLGMQRGQRGPLPRPIDPALLESMWTPQEKSLRRRPHSARICRSKTRATGELDAELRSQ